MNTITRILDLFDELDAYEAYDLMEALADRGYELKINRELEEKQRYSSAGLYLVDYDESFKIAVIKLIRNFHENYKQYVDSDMGNVDLKTAKEFCEDRNQWDQPIAIGKPHNLKIIYDNIQYEYNDRVRFQIE